MINLSAVNLVLLVLGALIFQRFIVFRRILFVVALAGFICVGTISDRPTMILDCIFAFITALVIVADLAGGWGKRLEHRSKPSPV